MIVEKIDELLKKCKKQAYQLALPDLLQYGMLFEDNIPNWEYAEYKTWDYGITLDKIYFIITKKQNSDSNHNTTIRTFQLTDVGINISDKDSTIAIYYDDFLTTRLEVFWEAMRDLYQVIQDKKR